MPNIKLTIRSILLSVIALAFSLPAIAEDSPVLKTGQSAIIVKDGEKYHLAFKRRTGKCVGEISGEGNDNDFVLSLDDINSLVRSGKASIISTKNVQENEICLMALKKFSLKRRCEVTQCEESEDLGTGVPEADKNGEIDFSNDNTATRTTDAA